MNKRVLFFSMVLVLAFALAGCTILTSEEAALVGTGEVEEKHIELYLNTPRSEPSVTPEPGPDDEQLPTETAKTGEQADDEAEITYTDINVQESADEEVTETEGFSEKASSAKIVSETDSPTDDRDLTPLPSEYFDDAIFFGDSVSGTIEYMDDNYGSLGKAITLVKNSYSLRAAAKWDEAGVNILRYRNAQGGPDAILAALPDVHKAFIMLGMNDITSVSDENYVELWTILVDNIRKVRPDVKIYFESLTPVTAANDGGTLNNTEIDKYNSLLRTFAADNDCNYITVGEHFKDEDGTLRAECAKPDGKHLNLTCGQTWVDILKDPANYDIDPRAGE